MNTGYHLPHNAVVVEEFEFMLSLLDKTKDFYIYEDLKALFFEEMVKNNLFEIFHKKMYERIMNSSNMKNIYLKIQKGENKYEDLKKLYYSDTSKKPSKNFNQNWNEIIRDYLEFMAFLGILPTYYKGKNRENEKKHYISNTFIRYTEGKMSLSEIVLGMKFRNASKDYSNFEMYDITLRPFVVALKILQYAKDKDIKIVDGAVLSGLVKMQKNEVLNDFSTIDFNNRNNNNWTSKQIKEFGRGLTFMKQWLNKVLKIPIAKGRTVKFDISNFDIKNYNFFENAIFIGERYNSLEITPQIANIVLNPSKCKDKNSLKILEEAGLIVNNKQNAHINFDTDLPTRELVLEAYNLYIKDDFITFELDEKEYLLNIEKDNNFDEGFKIAKSSDGTAYEEFIHEQLIKAFKSFKVEKLGSHHTGQRVSDSIVSCTTYHHKMKSNIKIIIECKAGKAIKSFDERKEIDNINNTLKLYDINDYDGVWYIITDSNQIPSQKHGGYRNNNASYSFEEKLLEIQFDIQMATGKPTIVTAFSYEMFMKFLSEVNDIDGIITSHSAKHFWVWSKRFVNKSYISVQA
ncbi:hypothetical protein DP17_1373 [Staphylococcus epidermidis]|nr:hypothetical protein DP17_1373 [Staphylococcus epidermidis]